MADSTATLANLALSHCGGSAVVITNLSTDTTLEGKACRAFYELAKRETLLAYPWNVAQVQAELTLIEEITTEPTEWTYKYRLPEDCLMPQRILWDNIRTPPSGWRVPYRLLRDTESTTYDAAVTYAVGDYALSATVWYRCIQAGTGQTPASSPLYWVATSTYSGVPPQWLLCDVPEAFLEYTVDITDPRFFTPDLDNAIAARLAFYIAPKVSQQNANLRAEMAELWGFLIRQAASNDSNNEQRDPEPPSSFEVARDTFAGDW
jgi:hypothetical protein